MRWLIGPYAEARTYRVVGYLVLGLGLATFEFSVLVTGFSLGLGLLITLFGIPILVATFAVAHVLATVEGRLASRLLDARLPRRRTARLEASGFFWARLRSVAAAPRTWREVFFLLVRLPMAVLDFAYVVTIVGLALGGFALPVVFAAGVDTQIASWTIDTFGESLVFVPLSAFFLLVGPRLVLGWSELSRHLASRLLGRVDASELKREIAEVLASSHGVVDAFDILSELGLRLGHGPFLTPTRIEAALLALRSSGYVTSHQDGRRTTYSLN